MKVLLLDIDSKIPNLALMKLSTFHKKLGDEVNLIRYGLGYYPNKKSKIVIPVGYDLYYASIIFTQNKNVIEGENIITGGTGVDLTLQLAKRVNRLNPDYSLYPDNDTSYGFLTRGCDRNCGFCFVPKKEGKLRQVNTVDNIVRHKQVKFLDNNFLMFKNHTVILNELVSKRIRCCFNQGLDIRCLNSENSNLLSKLNYIKEYTFAFDCWEDKTQIESKLKLLDWASPWSLRFFLYCNANNPITDIVNRVDFLKRNSCLPYLMRDVNCWGDQFSEFYTDLAAYCNQPGIFKKMDFYNFLDKRHTRKERVKTSKYLFAFGLKDRSVRRVQVR